jgi:hypothetical protein
MKAAKHQRHGEESEKAIGGNEMLSGINRYQTMAK